MNLLRRLIINLNYHYCNLIVIMDSNIRASIKNIPNLTDHELRESLKKYNENPGPITESTRNIYRKKLTSLLQGQKLKDDHIKVVNDVDEEETSDEDFILQEDDDEEDSEQEEEEEEDEEEESELDEQEKEELLKDLERDVSITTRSSSSGYGLRSCFVVLLAVAASYAYKEKLPVQKIIPFVFLSFTFYLTYWIFGFFRRRSQSHAQKVCKMVAQALELLQSPENPKGMMPVLHIRDTLLSPTERKTKKDINLWNECVKFVEHHESRVKVEIVNVEGEDFKAWKWIGPRK